MREDRVVNSRRTLRLWCAHNPQRAPQRRHKHQRLGDDTATRLRAERPNHVWPLDLQLDETTARLRLELLNVIDEHTREALAITFNHSIDTDGVVATVEAIASAKGARAHLRMDNGPNFTFKLLAEPGHQVPPHGALSTPDRQQTRALHPHPG